MQIASYSPEHFPAVVAFLRENWAAKHALYDRALFDWQYRTAKSNNSLVVVEEGRVLAFLGNIPGRYCLDGDEFSGVGLTMWCVARELRNGGLGVRLIRAAEKAHRATLTLGAGQAALPMYQAMGYSVLARLHRYVLPLESEGFERLLIARQAADSSPLLPLPPGEGRGEGKSRQISLSFPSPRPSPGGRGSKRDDLSSWHTHSLQRVRGATLPSDGPPDALTLARLYEHCIRPAFRFSQVRDADFWQWRYIDNIGFRYYRFGDRSRGAVIARLESVVAPQCQPIDGLMVLRLIEILPPRRDDWDGVRDLVAGVISWAMSQGCVAADYQCVSSRPGQMLEKVGFRDQSAANAPPVTQLGQLFQPFRPNAAPINFVSKIVGRDGRPVPLDPDDCYFVKSDCDMDRPVLWPLPTCANNRAQAC